MIAKNILLFKITQGDSALAFSKLFYSPKLNENDVNELVNKLLILQKKLLITLNKIFSSQKSQKDFNYADYLDDAKEVKRNTEYAQAVACVPFVVILNNKLEIGNVANDSHQQLLKYIFSLLNYFISKDFSALQKSENMETAKITLSSLFTHWNQLAKNHLDDKKITSFLKLSEESFANTLFLTHKQAEIEISFEESYVLDLLDKLAPAYKEIFKEHFPQFPIATK